MADVDPVPKCDEQSSKSEEQTNKQDENGPMADELAPAEEKPVESVSVDVVLNRDIPKFTDWAGTYNQTIGRTLDLPPGCSALGVFLKSIFLAVAKQPYATLREIQEFLMTVYEKDPGLRYVESVVTYNCESGSMTRHGTDQEGYRYYCPSDELMSASVRYMTRVMLWKRTRPQ